MESNRFDDDLSASLKIDYPHVSVLVVVLMHTEV